MKKTKKPSAKKAETGMAPRDVFATQAIAEEELSALLTPQEAEEKKAEDAPLQEEAPKKKQDDVLPRELALLKEILSRLMDDLGVYDLAALREAIDRAEIQKLMAGHNLSEDAARLFLAQQEKLRTARLSRRASERRAEMEALRKDPFYADIDDHMDALEAFCFRTGLGAREGYNALFAEKKLRSLLKDNQEQATEKEKKAKNIPALSGGGAPEKSAHVKLTEAEMWAAERAGMTPAEYAKYKYAQA